MKLSSFGAFLVSLLTTAARLSPRQDNCARNNCYNAIWVSDPDLVIRGVLDCQKHLTTTEIVFPLVTSTYAEVTLTTTTTPCPTAPISISAPTATSTSSFAFGAKRNNARQVVPTPSTSSTTTTYGPVPTYATGNCDMGNYRSACLCKSFFGITSALINTISTTSTLYVTSTFTNTITTGTPCPTTSATTFTPSSTTQTDTSSSSSSISSTATTSSSSISTGTSGSSSSTETSSSVSSTDTSSSISSTGTTSSESSATTTSSSSSSTNSETSSLSSSTLSSTLSTTTTAGYSLPTPICNGNGVALCDGGCQDLRTSNGHCGACFNACASGKTCANGVCTSTACDSTYCPETMLRYCNNNGTSNCACAVESEGRGVCFDTDRFKCNETDPLKPRVDRCVSTAGCRIGFVCVREFCGGCNGTTTGICVSTEGCGRAGADNNGPLVSYGRMGRSVKLF